MALSSQEPLRVRTRAAGIFLFLPLLAELGFDALVRKADYPGTKMVPADAALLSLLALKLLRKERLSHIDDYSIDEGLGLFAGLNADFRSPILTDMFFGRSAFFSGFLRVLGWFCQSAWVGFDHLRMFSGSWRSLGTPRFTLSFHSESVRFACRAV